MNESNPGNNYEQPPISAVTRYYADINYADGSYATIVMAVDSLLESLPFKSDLRVDSLGSEFLPLEWKVELEPRIATERLSLLPLAHIGPQLDKSDCPTAEIKKWYDHALTGVRRRTGDNHDNSCLESGNAQHLMCKSSTICPQRFMERYVSDDLMHPDFSDDRYQTDPSRMYTITSDKLELAIKHGIILKEFGETLKKSYANEWHKRFQA
ncbi:MAG TPA: hypothetical protein VFM68_02960 [Candidatus Saccharimonadales bacterium]|nr:hypothetical protein [Candidatus Saccharimonadales bacterium]